MAEHDDRDLFRGAPGCAKFLSDPDLVWHVPASRSAKVDGEDSLFAEIFKTPRTLSTCLVFHPIAKQPTDVPTDRLPVAIPEVSILVRLGDGMNGHAGILHGGVVATLIDEGMGMLQGANVKFWNEQSTFKPDSALINVASFTVDLRITYLRPVTAPGVLLLEVRFKSREGRKQWMTAEVKQFHRRNGAQDDQDGEWKVCSTGEAMFVDAKPNSSKM